MIIPNSFKNKSPDFLFRVNERCGSVYFRGGHGHRIGSKMNHELSSTIHNAIAYERLPGEYIRCGIMSCHFGFTD